MHDNEDFFVSRYSDKWKRSEWSTMGYQQCVTPSGDWQMENNNTRTVPWSEYISDGIFQIKNQRIIEYYVCMNLSSIPVNVTYL